MLMRVAFITITIMLSFIVVVFFTYVHFSDKSVSRQSLKQAKSQGTELTGESPTENPNDDRLSQLSIDFKRLTIPYMREQQFPGSEIKVIETISSNGSYTSYVASYQSEGLTVYGLLTRPNGEPPDGGFPAVVFLHGYIPPLQYRTTEQYAQYVNSLARQDMVVFKIDMRGHGNSEGESNGAYFSADYIFDTLNAYASLQKLDYVNAEKVALWGHSMSGNLVLRSMAINTDIPLGVIWAGAVYTYADMMEFSIQDSSYQPRQNQNRGKRQEIIDTFGLPEKENWYWSQVAPTTFVSDITGLVQIHHAVNDSVVSIEYSKNVIDVLENAGTNYEFYEYQSGGHNIEGSVFNDAMRRTVEAVEQL